MRQTHGTQESPEAPILPEGFLENASKKNGDIEDDFTPATFDGKSNKPVYNYMQMVYHLYYTHRFVWLEDYGRFYKLHTDGRYHECSERKDIGNAIIDKIIKGLGTDNTGKNFQDGTIHKLKCKSENLLEEEREQFLSNIDDGIDIKQYYDVKEGELPLIHVENGWINPNPIIISKRDGDGNIIKDSDGDDIPETVEGCLLPECCYLLSADSLFWLKVRYTQTSELYDTQIPYGALQERFHFKAEPEDMERFPTFQSILDCILPNFDTQYFLLSLFASTIFDRFSDYVEPIITILYGVGGTGKTTLISCIEAILGGDGFTETTFKDLTEGFGYEPLIGKKMLVINEVRQITENTMNELKRISDGRAITIKRKHIEALTTNAYARRVFMTNNKVPSFDLDSGSIRRLAVIEMSSFLPISINAPEVMTSEEGINWLFNKLLQIWIDNRKNKRALSSLISEEMKGNLDDLTTEKNPIMAWIKFRFGSISRAKDKVEEVRQKLSEGYFDEHLDSCIAYIKENEEAYPDTDTKSNGFSRDFKDTIYQMYGLKKVQTRKGDGSKRYRFVLNKNKEQ